MAYQTGGVGGGGGGSQNSWVGGFATAPPPLPSPPPVGEAIVGDFGSAPKALVKAFRLW